MSIEIFKYAVKQFVIYTLAIVGTIVGTFIYLIGLVGFIFGPIMLVDNYSLGSLVLFVSNDYIKDKNEGGTI